MKSMPEMFSQKLRSVLDEKIAVEKIVVELPSNWNKLDTEEVGWEFEGKMPKGTHGPNFAKKKLIILGEELKSNSK